MTREEALDGIRIRCLLTRRIVPFLVHEQRQRGGAPAEIALRLGLREADVLAYVEEIEGEVRAMMVEAAFGAEDPSPRAPYEGYLY